MRIEECLIELVCHVRWLSNYIITQTNPAAQQRYPAEIEAAKQIRHALSKPFCLVESISEIPNNALNHLCEGALYLIAGEAILASCPPTMHQFLTQTSLQRQQSAQQAQLLVVRWFIAAKILSVEDLLEVVFGPDVTVASYATDYDAHMAIAKHLAEPDPFFLGAHITILRSLLLQYCSTLLTTEDVVNHVALINPNATAELHTLEHTMLFWLRSVLGCLLNNCAAANELTIMDDLYLHTNDGRVISLVINYYTPDLLPVSTIHLTGPVTVWERQENWSNVIRAAEGLGLWVGIFADEMVAHGFSMLQYHVLRVVEELFAVLASNAEQSYDSLSKSVQATTELEGNTTFVDADVVHSIMGGVNFETFQPDLVADGDFVGAPAEHIDTDESDASPSSHRFRGNSAAGQLPELGVGDVTPVASGAGGDQREQSAGTSVVSPQQAQDDGDGDLEEYDNTDGEEYGVVMTGMFLQGISLPIHRQETRPSEIENNVVAVDISPTTELRKSAFVEQLQPAAPNINNQSVVEDASTFEVHDVLRPCSQLESTPPPNYTNAAEADDEEGSAVAPQRTGDSPSVATHDRKALKQRECNALSASLAHLRRHRPQTVGAARASVAAVVQGSIDTEGIEGLLKELSALGTANRQDITAGGPSSESNLKEQNLKMQWALEEQQRQIRAMVDRLRAGIRKAEFSAIMKHLKGSKQPPQLQQRGGCSPQSDQVRLSFASLPPRSEAPLTDRSVVGTVDDLRKSQQVARIPPSLAVANPSGVDQSSPKQRLSARLDAPVLDNSATGPTSGASSKPKPRADGIINVSVTSLRTKIGAQNKNLSSPPPPVSSAVADQTLQIPQLQKLRERHQKRLEEKKKNSPRTEHHAPTTATAKLTPPPQPQVASENAAVATTQISTDAPLPATGATLAPPGVGTAPPTGIVPLLAPVIKMRSNKLGITNALKHVLLTGTLNKTVLDNALKVLQDFSEKDNNQFVILLKDEYAHQFRGIYVVRPDNSITKIFGSGPTNALQGVAAGAQATITVDLGTTGATAAPPALDPKFYKFDSSSKKFQPLPSKSINQMTDALVFSGLKQPKGDRERW